jgi:hypothetical protein
MDPSIVKAVRQNLLSLGYRDLSDSLVEEFAQRLQEDEGFTLSPQKPSPAEAEPRKRSAAPRKPAELISGSDSEPEDVPNAQSRAPAPGEKPLKVTFDTNDDEISEWSKRLKILHAKGQSLDTQIKECRSAIMDDPGDAVQDVSLYSGTSERKLHPYPAVQRSVAGGGGFIRPPPVRSSKRATGPSKGKRLLYEQRFPDYVPPPERRRDELRWKIRQQLAYSDPKYQ